jgi:hypothetical protein
MLIKLCCKIFWSCSYMEIPDVLLQDAQFAGWMQALLTFVTQPVPAVGVRQCLITTRYVGVIKA